MRNTKSPAAQRYRTIMGNLAARRHKWILGGPYLYVMGCGAFVKIGKGLDPQKRLFQCQTGNPHEIRLLVTVPLYLYTEERAHGRFDHLRIRGEWFHRTREMDAFIVELRDRLSREGDAQRRIDQLSHNWSRSPRKLAKI